MSIHHKNCGGELYIKQWTDYGSDGDVTYGVLPDYYCRKCDAFIMGDAQIKESMDDIQFGLCFNHSPILGIGSPLRNLSPVKW